MPKHGKKIRITIDLCSAAYQGLTGLATKVGSTKSDVMRIALQTLTWLLKEKESGSQIICRDADGKEREAVLFF